MEKWIGEMGPEVAEKVIESLTKVTLRSLLFHALIIDNISAGKCEGREE